MSDEVKKGCNYWECSLNWLKIVDDWAIAGYKNKFPRMYYVVILLLILIMIM